MPMYTAVYNMYATIFPNIKEKDKILWEIVSSRSTYVLLSYTSTITQKVIIFYTLPHIILIYNMWFMYVRLTTGITISEVT